MWDAIKRIKKYAVCGVLFTILLLCGACGGGAIPEEKKVTVNFIDNVLCVFSQKTVTTDVGNDITVVLHFRDGTDFSGCSYRDYSVKKTLENTKLTLHNVRYSERVGVSVAVMQASILYQANGGHFYDGREESYFLVGCVLNDSGRTNTQPGTDIMYREDHILTGWNTERDGSGEHVGLGSRVSLEKRECLTLYAEWKKQTAVQNFSYQVQKNGVVLTQYLGEKELDELVIPRMIEGKKVVAIGRRFARGIKIHTLILPETLQTIEESAFYGGFQAEEIYFFDSINSINDMSFGNTCIKTWHINAVRAPRYRDASNSQFAENIDRLMATSESERDRLLFFGGCSMSYGLVSEMISQAFPDYQVLNLGVIGGINAAYQFDIITNYIKEGDVFIHAPEEGSPYQLMALADAEPRIFITVEGNYDLLVHADFSSTNGMFAAFENYNTARDELPETAYEMLPPMYNRFGDYIGKRPFEGIDKSFSDGEYRFDLSLVNDASIAALCDKYDAVRERGAKIYFSFAPFNRNGVALEDWETLEWLTFEAAYREALSARGYEVISQVESYMFPGRFFFDTDYHLNDEGAKIRTRLLIEDLNRVL